MTSEQQQLHPSFSLVILSMAFLFCCGSAPAAAQDAECGPPPLLAAGGALPVWSGLHFQARKAMLTGKVAVTLEVPVSPAGEASSTAATLTTETRFLSRRRRAALRFDGSTGAAWELIRVQSSGDKLDYKRLEFSACGVGVSRAQGDLGFPPPTSTWPATSDVVMPFDDHLDCAEPNWVVETAALLYLLSSKGFLDEDLRCVTLPVLAGDEVIRVAVELAGTESLEVDYLRERGDQEPQRTKGTIAATVVRVRNQGLAGDTVELMGLEGDAIEILLDPSTRIPVEVRGSVRFLGQLRVRLRRVELREVGPR